MTGEEEYWAQFPDALSIADVAKITHVGVQAVRGRLRRGTIPARRIGDTWIIFREEIRAWLADLSNQRHPDDTAAPVDVLADSPDELDPRDLMRLLGVRYRGRSTPGSSRNSSPGP